MRALDPDNLRRRSGEELLVLAVCGAGDRAALSRIRRELDRRASRHTEADAAPRRAGARTEPDLMQWVRGPLPNTDEFVEARGGASQEIAATASGARD